MKEILLRKIYIWLLLTINLLFAFIIGTTIPLLESPSRYNFGFIMIPLLIILNYIIIDRFHYYLTQNNIKEENADDNN
ncbi:MAG: archaeosortase H N-terminal-like domain-containing protein [Candidatus Hodarchaeota archaeon]